MQKLETADTLYKLIKRELYLLLLIIAIFIVLIITDHSHLHSTMKMAMISNNKYYEDGYDQ
jgi:hypothetical protein